MRIRIRHRTTYHYDEPVYLGPHVVRLRPAAHTPAPVLSYNLAITPDCDQRWQQDPWANRICRVAFDGSKAVNHLSFTVDAAFDIRPVNPFDFFVDEENKQLPVKYEATLAKELAPFLGKPRMSKALEAFVERVPATGGTVDYLVALNAEVSKTVGYIIRTETGVQTSEETLTLGKGSCRDSAILLVDSLRARGLAARFASGYLVQLRDEGNLPGEAKGVAEDVVDLHAWAEVYLPGAGWIGLDGTSGLLAGEGHIPLASTVNPEMAAPITGTASGAASNFEFELEVVRLGHEPRPRKPYEDETWQAIVAAGDAADQSLLDSGLTLTSGGEPTWTSRLHPTEAEWITEALGPTKLSQGLAMTRELAKKFGTGTLAMQRMGKHYPGETLPRWVLHLVWRDDGVPIWRDSSRLALGEGTSPPARKAPLAKEAEALARETLARETLAREAVMRETLARETLAEDFDSVDVQTSRRAVKGVRTGRHGGKKRGSRITASITAKINSAKETVTKHTTAARDAAIRGAAARSSVFRSAVANSALVRGMVSPADAPAKTPPALSARSQTSAGNGATSNGATSNGATSNGATGNGATSNGATSDGATGNGATGDGATGNGATGNDVALAFARTLANCLGVAPKLVAGFEDPWHFIREEQDLPEDVDPLQADLRDSEERRRLARVLTRGLGTVVGYALPIARTDDNAWTTAEWSFRRGHMFLFPGESPMGLRMPLDRRNGKAPESYPQDPSALTSPIQFQPGEKRAIPMARCAPEESMRTAICMEERDGQLHVFLPPMDDSESFLDLVAAVEDAATKLDLQVAVEGYGPPSDPRLRTCLVTPDPGVIEVNLPVCKSVREYTGYLDILSEAALQAGLSTEKFQLDGREVSSGGGNHITMGGPSPLESPFLTRPDLLGGLLRYIQNHPSLSFLFTGLFVGPTSQAPRVDEARLDSLAELELALSQLPRAGQPVPPPWKIDRLLRNLLVDVSGNTHRTEICIDKLYDPNSATGRQGLVELRAFEMPPHYQMATVQTLLVRALIARLAKEPYEQPLVRWGGELHDRFMLPHHLWADIKDIAADFERLDIPMDAEWFRPFLDHRCPVAGVHQIGDVELEIRLALEPWPVLGEQPSGAAVSRYVDASLERVQVRASGMTEGRHILTVNGITLPLHATGTNAERVAGVRFRAWQPPFCLQPDIGLHHPLRFDLIDTWGKRSLGSCTYHVWHPEGRGYDEPPLTNFEAAARRAQRFTFEGHAPWPATGTPAKPHPEHPLTLDMRLHSPGVQQSLLDK